MQQETQRNAKKRILTTSSSSSGPFLWIRCGRIELSDTKPKERRTRPDWRPLDWILVVSSPGPLCGIQTLQNCQRSGPAELGRDIAKPQTSQFPCRPRGSKQGNFNLRPANRGRAIARLKLADLTREIARPEAYKSGSAGLRPRDCPSSDL